MFYLMYVIATINNKPFTDNTKWEEFNVKRKGGEIGKIRRKLLYEYIYECQHIIVKTTNIKNETDTNEEENEPLSGKLTEILSCPSIATIFSSF